MSTPNFTAIRAHELRSGDTLVTPMGPVVVDAVTAFGPDAALVHPTVGGYAHTFDLDAEVWILPR